MENTVIGWFRFLAAVPFDLRVDRLLRLFDATSRVDGPSPAYPPYNTEKTGEDAYRLTMAVAGFSLLELDITVRENALRVTGKAQKEEEKKNGNGYLHRGARLSGALASPIT